MDIDPIDDGPRPALSGPVTATVQPMMMMTTATTATGNNNNNITQEEEARQAIDLLRGEDLSGRVSAAHRLDAIAKVLGPERTREVSSIVVVVVMMCWRMQNLHYQSDVLTAVLKCYFYFLLGTLALCHGWSGR